jgi:SRSO17 transposase
MATYEVTPVEETTDQRFSDYLDYLLPVFTHPAQGDAMRAYCTGLLTDGRKTVEPIAARLAPHRVSNAKRSLENFMNCAPWSHERLIDRAVSYALPALVTQAPIDTWIIDDTGIPKKGTHSVGVAHQYCGQLGKQANCQVAVTLSLANANASLPIAYQLYLNESWSTDIERRTEVGIPEEVTFATKPQISIGQIDEAIRKKLPMGTVLADAGYGNDTAFRDALTERKIPYVVSIQSTTTVWYGEMKPLPPKPYSGIGRRPSTLQRDEKNHPLTVKEVALRLSPEAYQEIPWRQGTSGVLSSRFARVRVRAAHRETHTQREEEWLIIEWPEGEAEPIKYLLSTLPEDINFSELIDIGQRRWRIERDFQELKSELGLNEYEGRSWRGFHRHASLCLATYAFLLAERGRFSPSGVLESKSLPFPPVRADGVLPVIAERHNPYSFRSWCRRLKIGIVRRLTRCPACLRENEHRARQESEPSLVVCQ